MVTLVVMRQRLRFTCSAVAAALVARASTAQPVALTYEAPPECPSAQWVIERTARLVRNHPTVPTAANATITHTSQGYILELQVDGGRRRIVSESCDSLVQTLTVILSLSVEPRTRATSRADEPPRGDVRDVAATEPHEVAATAAAQAENSSSGTQPATPAVQVVVEPRRVAPLGTTPSANPLAASNRVRPTAVTAPDRQTRQSKTSEVRVNPTSDEREPTAGIQVHPTILLFVEYGMLPHPAYGPRVGAWLDWQPWSAAVTAQWLLPQWAPMPGDDPRRGGYVSFLGGQVNGCRMVARRRLLGLCVGVEAGDMMGKGSGITSSRLGHGVWLSGNVEVVTRPRLWSLLSTDLRLGLSLPVKRPAFGIDGYDWKFEPHGWSLRLASGFSWL